MNYSKIRFSPISTKLIKRHKNTSQSGRRNKLIYHRKPMSNHFMEHDMTFDEMIDASSLFDSLLNGASYVNQSSVSPKARLYVQRTRDKYEKQPQLLWNAFKKLNKQIVVANEGHYYSDPNSEALYEQLMNTSKIKGTVPTRSTKRRRID